MSGGHDFPAAAREALADQNLRVNLRRATQTIRARRAGAIAELADFEELRDQAGALKAGALDRLDELLDGFEAAFTAAGGHVHPAVDAAEANKELAPGVVALIKIAHVH